MRAPSAHEAMTTPSTNEFQMFKIRSHTHFRIIYTNNETVSLFQRPFSNNFSTKCWILYFASFEIWKHKERLLSCTLFPSFSRSIHFVFVFVFDYFCFTFLLLCQCIFAIANSIQFYFLFVANYFIPEMICCRKKRPTNNEYKLISNSVESVAKNHWWFNIFIIWRDKQRKPFVFLYISNINNLEDSCILSKLKKITLFSFLFREFHHWFIFFGWHPKITHQKLTIESDRI